MTPIAVVEQSAVAAIRKILLAILVLGMFGSITELILLKHTEDVWQWIPLILIAAGLIACAWHGISGGAPSMRVIRWLMFGFVLSGGLGVYFHYRGLTEFKLEANPSLAGWDLFLQAVRGKTPPLLAPGAMIQLGLLGLAFTYKHPTLSRSKGDSYGSK